MNLLLPISGLPLWLTAIATILIVAWSCLTAHWQGLKARSSRQHLWFGSILFLGIFWGLGISVRDVFLFHPMLVTSLVFIFGLRLSLIAGFVAQCITHVIFDFPLQSFGLSYLCSIVAPAVFIQGLILLIKRIKVQNLFIYILGGGFLGGIFSIGIIVFTSAIMVQTSSPNIESVFFDNLTVLVLLCFPEGFCNGAIVSTLTVFAPDLVRTYDDDFYLKKD